MGAFGCNHRTFIVLKNGSGFCEHCHTTFKKSELARFVKTGLYERQIRWKATRPWATSGAMTNARLRWLIQKRKMWLPTMLKAMRKNPPKNGLCHWASDYRLQKACEALYPLAVKAGLYSPNTTCGDAMAPRMLERAYEKFKLGEIKP